MTIYLQWRPALLHFHICQYNAYQYRIHMEHDKNLNLKLNYFSISKKFVLSFESTKENCRITLTSRHICANP